MQGPDPICTPGAVNENVLKEATSLPTVFIITKDTAHSATEDRYRVLGKTDEGRILFLTFALRGDKIRVITARDVNKRERKAYEEAKKSAAL